MARDLKDVVQQIKLQADIVGVVGRTVALKKAGNTYKGLCPFHREKTPSFNVVPAKNIFHCFGCGSGGSVIDFVMRVERLEFIDAVKMLAAELGIEVPDARGPRDEVARQESERHQRDLRGANDFALEWFRANLMQGRAPVAATYMKERGIDDALGERFRLGAAPDGWTPLLDAATRAGFTPELMVEAGLAVRNDESGRVYDRFRNRLIFPILDHLGRAIGFGGRRLDDDPRSPKYLNSAETDLYKKGNSLYALNWAKDAIVESGFAILTEGYMDTLMAHQFGFPQAVASLGTALTPDQARLLRRFATRVYFLYDGDSAGQKAMLRGGESLLAAGIDARTIALPPEDDPDSFLRREGAPALRARLDDAVEFFDYALDAHVAAGDARSIAGRAGIVAAIEPTLRAFTNDVAREGAISRLLLTLGGLPREALDSVLRAKPAARVEEPTAEGTAPVRLDALDQHLLKVMLENFEGLEVVRERLELSWLVDRRLEPWIAFFLSGHDRPEVMIEEARLADEMPGDYQLVTQLLALDSPVPEGRHAAEQLLARLQVRHRKAIAQELLGGLNAMDRADPESVPMGALNLFQDELRLAAKTEIPKGPHRIE